MTSDHRLLGIAFVLAAAFAEAVGHVIFKNAADRGHRAEGIFASLRAALAEHGHIAGGLGAFALDIVFWTLALKYLDVSLAFPLSSLSLIMVVFLSRLWLKEKISPRRWIGVSLILLGTVFVGLS
jgi:drug/metabolite transporter (DMT)-like permease